MKLKIELLEKVYIEEGSKTALMPYGNKGRQYWLDMLKADLNECKGMRVTKEGIEFDQRLLECQSLMKVLNQLNSDIPFCSIYPELFLR